MTRLLFRRRDSYLHTSGLLHTFKVGRPETIQGDPIPWMNYSVVAFLRERLTRDLTLFEFGSGFSTYFYAGLAKEVLSVEYNRDWYEKIGADLPDNVSLMFREWDCDGDYCRAALASERLFDVIVIDGRDRVNCARNALDALNDRGVILFDDTQREEYRDGIQYLLARGFRQIDFEGLKPASVKMSRATMFYRPGNCLGV